jgi:hypothetical protein
MQTVLISPDGSWVFTDKRSGGSKQGHLTAAQMTTLRQLVSDPNLATEARRSPPPMACNDAVTWTISVGELTVREQDCGGNYPATDAVIRFVTDNTAL